VIAIRKPRNEIAEHVRRGGKAVQQEERWRDGIAGLAIEDLVAVDGGMAMSDGHGWLLCLSGTKLEVR
jgi:hypothetical protein